MATAKDRADGKHTWGDKPDTTKQETTDTRHNTMATAKGWEGGGHMGDQPNTTEPKTTDTRHNTMETTNVWEGGWAKQASPDSRGEV